MSDAELNPVEDLDKIIDDDSIGQTSEESAQEEQSEKKGLAFSVYDGMLLLALLCVTAATLILFLELRSFGPFPSVFPWRTSEVLGGSGILFPLF